MKAAGDPAEKLSQFPALPDTHGFWYERYLKIIYQNRFDIQPARDRQGPPPHGIVPVMPTLRNLHNKQAPLLLLYSAICAGS
ncbi:hypothetical protein GSbR_03410 [Geobacter sp. SVR]|nr:hypothetical protein GSVR_40450 [Geobacter sp. SVR]GCF83741.1 hypothetical protein GSbR_03410 [Geobacter sp. SVR]